MSSPKGEIAPPAAPSNANLTPCPSCDKAVSIHAAACPGCGHPLASRTGASTRTGRSTGNRKLLFACCVAAIIGTVMWFGASAKVRELDHTAVLILQNTRGIGPGEDLRREQAFYETLLKVAPFVALGSVLVSLYVAILKPGSDR